MQSICIKCLQKEGGRSHVTWHITDNVCDKIGKWAYWQFAPEWDSNCFQEYSLGHRDKQL